MTKHSIFSPSGADRWINCTGSIEVCKNIQKTSSSYADEGSKAHELAAWMLSGGYKPYIPPEYKPVEMVRYVQKYVAYINKYKFKNIVNITYIAVEETIDIPYIGMGTVDCFVLQDEHLHVFDLKYGKGKRVHATCNFQLMIYAYGIIDLFDGIQDIGAVELHIIQPRINKDGRVDNWATSSVLIKRWFETVVVPTIDKIKAGDVGLQNGEWCWFCPARSTCIEIISKDYDDAIQEEL